jgi:hypothetical protein
MVAPLNPRQQLAPKTARPCWSRATPLR